MIKISQWPLGFLKGLARYERYPANQLRCLIFVVIGFSPLYLFRSYWAWCAGDTFTTTSASVSFLLLVLFPFFLRMTGQIRRGPFFLALVLLTGEMMRETAHLPFPPFLVWTAPAIFFVFSMSGFCYSIVLSLWALGQAMGFLITHGTLAPRAHFSDVRPQLTQELLIHLLLAQVIMAILAILLQFVLDTSTRRAQQQKVLRARTGLKSALAEVLGSMAHEINNPLGIFHAALFRYRRVHGSAISHHALRNSLMDHMQKALDRIRNITSNLRIFSEADFREPVQTIRASDLMAQAQSQNFEKARSYGVTIQVMTDIDPGSIACRPNLLLFVLTVMLDHAIEASLLESRVVQVSLSNEDDFCRIQTGIHHEGRRSSSADRPSSSSFPYPLDPEFPPDMKLCVCRSIIEELGGHMEYSSGDPDGGFCLDLPRRLVAAKE